MAELRAQTHELLPCTDLTRGRATMRGVYTLAIGLAALTGVSVLLAKTDLVVDASALVVPLDETARVQSAQDGVVDRIELREGQSVRKGQLLMRLEHSAAREGLAALQAQLRAADSRVSVLEQLGQARAHALGIERRIAALQGTALRQRVQAAQVEVAGRVRISTTRTEQRQRAIDLQARGAVAASDVEQAGLAAERAAGELHGAEANAQQLEAELVDTQLRRDRLERDAEVSALSDAAALDQARLEQRRLQGALAQARVQQQQLDITAPRSGVVQNLAVLDRGDVVRAGETLARIVPARAQLVLIARVAPADIAPVRVGLPVRVKLDAYPFQDFGVMHGLVARVAQDADRAADLSQAERGAAPYSVQIQLLPFAANGGKARLALRAGMTGRVEFVVRRERIAFALLRPFRGSLDSLHH